MLTAIVNTRKESKDSRTITQNKSGRETAPCEVAYRVEKREISKVGWRAWIK